MRSNAPSTCVRVARHTGTPLLAEDGYVGVDVHRAARVAASGHGGQVLLSQATASLVDGELCNLGEHRFKDLLAAERVYQLRSEEFPPLRPLRRTNLPVAARANSIVTSNASSWWCSGEEAWEREKTIGSTMTVEQAIALAQSLPAIPNEQSPRSPDGCGPQTERRSKSSCCGASHSGLRSAMEAAGIEVGGRRAATSCMPRQMS